MIVVIYHRLMLMFVDIHNMRPDRHHFRYQWPLISQCVQSKLEIASIDHSTELARERHHNFAGSISFRAPLGTCLGAISGFSSSTRWNRSPTMCEKHVGSRQRKKNERRARRLVFGILHASSGNMMETNRSAHYQLMHKHWKTMETGKKTKLIQKETRRNQGFTFVSVEDVECTSKTQYIHLLHL